MQISTTVRMDLAEVNEAVLAYIQDKLSVSEDANIEVMFDAESDVFVIEIAGTQPVTEPEKKTRKRRTKAEIEAETAVKAEPSEPVLEKSEAPWEEKPAEAKTDATSSVSIFPDIKSSAPAPVTEETPTPEVTAKSLFANLTKPA